jgi:hypothetical protein
MTEIWARGKLKEEINAYLDENTHIGADVEILVEETAVVLKNNDGGYIRTKSSRKARRMRETVEEVNEAVPQSGVCLTLPLSTLSPLHSSPASSIRLHTSPRRRREEVHMVADSTLDKAHAEVKRRCPTAWSWNHRLSDDGRHIIYDIPNLALRYSRSFVRGSWDCVGRFYAPVQNIPSDWRKHMRIGGEPVVELDYDNLHIAMLYAEEGKRLGGDAYDITADFSPGYQSPQRYEEERHSREYSQSEESHLPVTA